jgi:hypothetical protein
MKRFVILLSLFVSACLPNLRAAGELFAVVGYLNNDANPATGAVSNWGGTGAVALDCLQRSVALDLGTSKKISTITLRDSDGTSRLVAADYTIWQSNNNVTYTQVTGWSLTTSTLGGRLVHKFRLPSSVTARYVKVHNATYTGSSGYTFILASLSRDSIASSIVVGLLTNDTAPASGTVTSWGGTGSAALDYQQRSVVLDFSTSQRIRSVTLDDNNDTARPLATDYSLWASDDNITYTQISGWSLDAAVTDGLLLHTFVGFDVTARYLKVHSSFSDTSYTFVLANLQDGITSFTLGQPITFIALHSDGDRLFPPGTQATPCDPFSGSSATAAESVIRQEVDAIANAGYDTLKMTIGTDVLNYPSIVGSPRDWRIDDPSWALTETQWDKYLDLHGRALTARNFFTASPAVDPVLIAAEESSYKGMRFLLSYRIADTHFTADPSGYPLTSKFYLDHEAGADPVAISHSGVSPVPGYVRFDTLMNFHLTSVRNYRRDVIAEALNRYVDHIDGFEIDFTRSIALYPLGTVDATAVAEVTQFLQDVRDAMNLADPTHRLVLGLRVPGDQAVCLSQGLDVAKQIRERRVDFIVAANILTVPHDMDIRPWVAAGRPLNSFDRGVEIQSGLSARKPDGWIFPLNYTVQANYGTAPNASAEDAQLLGAAVAFRRMGAEAVELYNFAGLAGSQNGITRLGTLATNLTAASTGNLPKVFAVTPADAKPYEGYFEYIKSLPVEFLTDGTVWVNSTYDPTTNTKALVQQTGSGSNVHKSKIFVTGRGNMGPTEQWLLRIGIRNTTLNTSTNPYSPSSLNLKIEINGVELFSGSVNSSPASLVQMALEPAHPATTRCDGTTIAATPERPYLAPDSRDYITIPIPAAFALIDNNFNVVNISQNGTPLGFRVQEIQIGVFP